jgi:pimeloyl-ACP methyl ester carboxylesterase
MQLAPPIYAIPGLGMSPAIFDRLTLDLGPIHPISWIEPEDIQESFDHYCLRLSAQIDHHEGPIVLIGMSFGGLMAQRMTQMLPVDRLILISTLKASSEMPHWLRLMRQVPIYRLQNSWGRNRTFKLWAPRFGIDTQPFIDFCRPMFNAHSDTYFQWAVRQIVSWENDTYPQGLLHLHGDADDIFPHRYLGPHHAIKGGDHFMVYKQAEELSLLINAALADQAGDSVPAPGANSA